MIGVASAWCRGNHDPRTQLAKHLYEQGARHVVIGDAGIWQRQVLAHGQPHDPCGGIRFRLAQICGATRAHLALREIQHAD